MSQKMKPKSLNVMKVLFLYVAVVAFIPTRAIADTIPVHARHGASFDSRTVVFCDPGTEDCNSETASSDIEGAVIFDNTSPLFGNAKTPEFTLLSGSALDSLFENGYSGNTVFRDANSNGTGSYHGVTIHFVRTATVPEPATLELLVLGLVGLAWGARRRRLIA